MPFVNVVAGAKPERSLGRTRIAAGATRIAEHGRVMLDGDLCAERALIASIASRTVTWDPPATL